MRYLPQETAERVVLVPQGTEPSACVIWLHGLGADGYDFVPLVPELRLPASLPVRFVFPHAPVRAVTINGGARMRAWYDILGFTPGVAQDAAGIHASTALIERLIIEERSAGIPAARIVLAGFSQGGAIALYTALHHAAPLAGVLALSTYLPLGESLEDVAANPKPPILMCHGRYDPVLPIELADRAREVLRKHGYPVEWHEYSMQHQVCAEEVAAIAAWLRARLEPPAT
jgi:phospholipase/carboxylesterase